MHTHLSTDTNRIMTSERQFGVVVHFDGLEDIKRTELKLRSSTWSRLGLGRACTKVHPVERGLPDQLSYLPNQHST